MRRAGIAFVLLLCALAYSGCLNLDNRPARFASLSKSKPIEKEKSLSVKLNYGLGEMTLAAADPRTLYKLDLEYDESRVTPSVDYDAFGDRGRLDINVKGSTRGGKSRGQRLDLQLTTAIPVELAMRIGVSESSKIDLSNFQVKRLEMESGVGETSVSFDRPNPIACENIEIKTGVGELKVVGLGNANFSDLVFKGGIGAARLDFTGEWQRDADVEIKVGIGELVVILPRDLGVEIEGGKHFLASLHLESFHKFGDRHRSDNYDRAKHRMRLQVKAGIGSITVRWA